MLGELHKYPASTRESGATMTQMEVANRVLPLWHYYELRYLQSWERAYMRFRRSKRCETVRS